MFNLLNPLKFAELLFGCCWVLPSSASHMCWEVEANRHLAHLKVNLGGGLWSPLPSE